MHQRNNADNKKKTKKEKQTDNKRQKTKSDMKKIKVESKQT